MKPSVAWYLALLAVAGPYAYARPAAVTRAAVVLPALAREELVAVTLSPSVFAACGEGLRDLRVIDADGCMLPSVVRRVETAAVERVRLPCAFGAPRARPAASNVLELIFESAPGAAPAPPPGGLTVETPLTDFAQRVQVEGRAAEGAWQTLAGPELIYALERFVDVRQCDVAWFPRSCDRYRVTFFDAERDVPSDLREETAGPEFTTVRRQVRREPFRVSAVRFWRDESRPGAALPVLTNYPPDSVSTTIEDETAVLKFSGGRAPLRRVEFGTDAPLFCRPATLEGFMRQADGTRRRRTYLERTLTQVRFQDRVRRELTFELDGSRCDEYVLRYPVGADGSSGLTVTAAHGEVWQVVFVARPGAVAALTFGDDASPSAAREGALVADLLARGQVPLAAGLGVVEPGSLPRRPAWRRGLNSRAAMYAAMGLAGAALLYALVRAVRHGAA